MFHNLSPAMAPTLSPRSLHRILHVEDEPDIREILRLVLRLIGRFTVESCADGRQALLAAPEFQPDMILMDVMMPGMSGPETLAGLRALPSPVRAPVIFMTAKSRIEQFDRLRALGAVDVLAKPFDPLTVSEQIADIWARHGGH